MNTNLEPCRLCGSTELVQHPLGMLRCSTCHFFFLDTKTRTEQQANYHARSEATVGEAELVAIKQKYPKDAHGKRALYAHYAPFLLERFPDQNIRALDVGASGGFFLNHLEQAGVPANNLATLEVLPVYVALTKDYFGYEATIGNIETWQSTEPFNLISMFDVLEHVDDFKTALSNLHSLLATDGRLFLKLPNGRFAYLKYRIARFFGLKEKMRQYLHIKPGGHLNYWDVHTIPRLEQFGFSVEYFGYVPPKKEQFRRGWLPRAAAFWLDGLLHTHLFPEMVVILKKQS